MPENATPLEGSVVVRVVPSGVEVQVNPGESLMRAAERHGYRWPTLCHGQAQCTVCFITLDGDTDDFEDPAPLELEGLKMFAGRSFYDDKVVRLACQARPRRDTVVTKRGVRPQGS